MATDKLINHSQGESIISQLGDIATNLENVTTLSPAKFGMGYAVCDTAAGTAAKTATIANYRATEGALVTVKFTNGNTAANATLNLNSLGAVPILYKGSAIATDIIGVGDTCTFVYSTANSGSYTIINTDTLSGAGTVTSVGATGGIITDQTGGAAINSTGSVKLNLKSNTAYTGTVSDPATTDKIYPVALDGAGHPCVGVPWTDTTYSTFDATHAGLAPAGGTTAGFLKNDGSWATPQDTTYTGTGAIDVNNTTHVISVADGDITTKGVVQIKNSVGAASSASESLVVTEKAVASAIEALPEPMVFKGGITLTADSADTTKCSITLPSGVSSIKVGYTFKVISIASSPTYTGTLKVGDTFVADKTSAKTTSDWVENTDWSVIPSGDEPSGTVTEVAATDGITTASGSAISSTGTVKLNMVSSHTITGQSASAITATSNRTYPVGLDANNKVAVNIPWTDTTYEFADSYNASTNKGATVATVTNAINALDVAESSIGATKTIASWKQENGAVAITTQDISIPIAQVNNVSANNTAVTGVSATTATSGTGYVGMCSYDSTTKTLTINNLLAPTASTFVKKTS